MQLTRPVNLARLQGALGIPLGINGTTLHTYRAVEGSDVLEPAPFPAGHEAAVTTEQDAYAAEQTQETTARQQFRDDLAIVRAYLSNASPTAAQREAYIRALGRTQLRNIRLSRDLRQEAGE